MLWPRLLLLVLAGILSEGLAAAQGVPLTTQVFPVFPDGLSPDGTTHTTALVMQNPDLYSSAGCNLTFYGPPPRVSGPDGRMVHSYIVQQFLPAGGFNILKTTPAGSLSNGYAKLDCSHPVMAYTVYSVLAASTLLSETTMPSTVAATGFQFINDARQGGRLAMAFANDNFYATLVQVSLGDLFGRTILVANVVVPRYSTVAKFLDDILPNIPPNHIGPVTLRATQRIYTTGLRFNGTSVTALSPAAQVP